MKRIKKYIHIFSITISVILGAWLGGQGLTIEQKIAVVSISCLGVIYGLTNE